MIIGISDNMSMCSWLNGLNTLLTELLAIQVDNIICKCIFACNSAKDHANAHFTKKSQEKDYLACNGDYYW